MASTTTAKKEIIDFLWDWAESHGDWGRLLVNKIVCTEDTLSQQDRDGVFNYFLQSISLHSGLPAVQITKPQYTAPSKQIELTSLSEINGVNRLAKNQSVDFSKNITVVYGENGTGKTGYSRILKSLGFSYDVTENIHCNIFKTPEPQSALIKFKLNGTAETFNWTGKNKQPELDNISVFNSSCVQISLADRQLIVSPIGFHLFNLITNELNELSTMLQTKLASYATVLTWAETLTPGTPQFAFISTLSAASTVEKFNELSVFTATQENELTEKEQELNKLNKSLITTEIDNLNLQIADLGRLISKIEVTQSVLSTANRKLLRAYNKVINELESKTQIGIKEIAEANGVELYQTNEFQSFIKSAEAYIKILNKQEYPQKSDICVYCKQPLENAAKELLSNYRALLNDTAQEGLQLARTKKGDIINGATKNDPQLLLHQPVFGYSAEEQIIQPSELTEYHEAIETYKAAYISDTETDGECPSFDFNKYINFLTEKKSSITNTLEEKKQTSLNIGTKETELKSKIAVLKDSKILSGKSVEVNAAIGNHKIKVTINRNFNSFNTASLSRKTTEAREELIRQNFNELFEKELKALRKSHIKIDLNFATAKGTSHVYQKLNSHALSEILSEGEQKAIALAEFLTELQLDTVKAPVIFDDPVNSLDHRIIDEAAKRLIELSKQRQVVIFTHSILLLNSFLQQKELAINKSSVMDFKFYSVKNNFDETGILGEVEEVNSYSYYTGKLDAVLLSKSNGKSEEELAAQGYGHLRAAIELTVEDKILQNVIRRYRKGVAFPGLIRIEGSKLDANKGKLNDIYEKCCVSIDGHSSPTEIHTSPTLAELKSDFDEFKKVRSQFTN